MSCFHPLPAYWKHVKQEDDGGSVAAPPSRLMVSLARGRELNSELSHELVGLPCGACLGCRTAAARQWCARCILESYEHQITSFWTFTYREADCPAELQKADVSGFLKRYRARIGSRRVRFFASGEYGEKKGRPHYHALLFGVWPEDPDVVKAWTDGFAYGTIATDERIAYNCGYTFKKLLRQHESLSEVRVERGVDPTTGEVLYAMVRKGRRDGRASEFRLMSRGGRGAGSHGIAGAARARCPSAFKENVASAGGVGPSPVYLRKLWKDSATADELAEYGRMRFAAFKDAQRAGKLTPEFRENSEIIAVARRRLESQCAVL